MSKEQLERESDKNEQPWRGSDGKREQSGKIEQKQPRKGSNGESRDRRKNRNRNSLRERK